VFTEAYNDFHDMDGEGYVLNFFGPEPGYVWLFPAGYTLSLWMNWDDYPTSEQDYDLYLYQYNSSTSSWEVVASSTNSQDGSIEPVEVIDYTNPVDDGIYAFAVVKYDATVDVDFTVFTSYSIANRVYSSSITDPGAYDDVVTVGAIASGDYESGPQESFSSQGPTTDDRGKPNMAGPDDCNSFTYGYWQGTSLSSPYVAGVCALIRSCYPEANESVIRDFIYSECVQDLGDPGFDNIYGYGRVVLPNEVPRVDVSTKIFLEGPYDPESESNVMTSLLTVPLASPYPEDPRTVSSVPADITDWVLVQLRSTADGSAVASKSAFLHKDGRIVADDGTTSQIEMNAPAGDYYIIIKHRNHLSIMSADAVSLNYTGSTLYDFTSSNIQFYGTGGTKQLESGVWGMWSGDIDQDGEITTSDYTIWYNSARAGDSGYQTTDINLDGEVTTSDYTIWYNNARAGASSEVPEKGSALSRNVSKMNTEKKRKIKSKN
jgi:hypothetical protein